MSSDRESPLEVSYTSTLDDYRAAIELHRAAGAGSIVRRLGGFVWAVAGLLGLGAIAAQGVTPVALLAIAGAGYWFLFRERVERAAVDRRYDRRPDRDRRVTWRMRDDGVEVEIEDVGQSRLSWDDVARAVLGRSGFLLYPSALVFLWLPRRAFEREDDVAAFVERAVRHLERVDVLDATILERLERQGGDRATRGGAEEDGAE